jgi:hypothetical protein
MTLMTLGLLVVFASVLCWMYWRNRRATLSARGHLLNECAQLLEGAVITRNEAGYAMLEGCYRGYPVRLTLEEDHIAPRKIPSLWLHVTVEGRNSAWGTLDMLVRPQNIEFYSPSWHWDGSVEPLPNWPAHAVYRTCSTPPDLKLIDPAVRLFFTDEKAKELLLTPQRLRMTYQAKQAERGDYLLLRATTFDAQPLPAQAIAGLVDQAVQLRSKLEGATA